MRQQVQSFVENMRAFLPGSVFSKEGSALVQRTKSLADDQFDMLDVRFPVAVALGFASREIPKIPEEASALSEAQSRELQDIIKPSIDRGTAQWIAGLGALGAAGFMTGAFQTERSFFHSLPKTPLGAGGRSAQSAVRPMSPINPVAPDKVFELAARSAATRVVGMDKTSLDLLHKTIGKAMLEGRTEGAQAVANAIRDVFPQMKADRSLKIANTEMNYTMSRGAFSRSVAMGARSKQWITVGDDRVSQTICQPNEATSSRGIPVLDSFESGHMTTPGHVQCRCSVVYFGATNREISEGLTQVGRDAWLGALSAAILSGAIVLDDAEDGVVEPDALRP